MLVPPSSGRLGVLGLCDHSLGKLFNDSLYAPTFFMDIALANCPAWTCVQTNVRVLVPPTARRTRSLGGQTGTDNIFLRKHVPRPERNEHERPYCPITRRKRICPSAPGNPALGVSKLRTQYGEKKKKSEREGGGGTTRTNAEPTYDADTDATRNPAQEAVPRTRYFADALQVVIWRQPLLSFIPT